jgi:hypothetical protein
VITDLLLQFVGSVVGAVLGVIPSVPTPSWLSPDSGAMAKVFEFLDSMGVWFPVGLLMTVLAAFYGIKLTAFGIKIARIVVSFLTVGGGSAG